MDEQLPEDDGVLDELSALDPEPAESPEPLAPPELSEPAIPDEMVMEEMEQVVQGEFAEPPPPIDVPFIDPFASIGFRELPPSDEGVMEEMSEVVEREEPPQPSVQGIPQNDMEAITFPQHEEWVDESYAEYLRAQKLKQNSQLDLFKDLTDLAIEMHLELERIRALLEKRLA